jgi:5-methylthioadenosine/S-adenosylhomocysteine deaminase
MGTVEDRGRGSEMQLGVPRNSSLTKYGLSPHSPYTVAEDVLRHIMMQNERSLPLAMHIAESKDEIKLLQRRRNSLEKLYQFANWELDRAPRGSSAFEYLGRIGFLSPRLLAVHCVQATENDIGLIRASKVSVAHCPRSNKELGVGRMPLKKFLDAGMTVGLGTDSLASVPTLNMWDEMRYAYRIHRRDGIAAEDIFRIATIGGAKALGLDKETGTIEPGKKADIIAVPFPRKNTGNLYNDLLRETKSCIMTMVNGKIIYREGQG